MSAPAPSLVFDLLASLTKAEFRDFQRWLGGRSPRRCADWQRLGDFIYPKVRLRKLARLFPTPEEIYQNCLPDVDYSPSHWRRYQHAYLQEIETFLLERSRDQRPDRRRYELVEMYRQRGLDRHFNIRLAQARRQAATDPLADAESLLNAFYLERSAQRVNLQTNRSLAGDLLTQAATLRQSLLALELRHSCQQLAMARLQSSDVSQLEIRSQQLIDEAAGMAFYQQPAIELYTYAARLYLSQDQSTGDEAFQSFQKTLNNHLARFEPEEQRDLLLIAINYALRQANANRREFLPQLFELYRKGLEEEILYERGRLSIFTFTNAFGAALQIGQVDWAEQLLLQQYRLPPDRAEEVAALAAARLAFLRKDYDQVLKELQKADYRDFIHHMTARLMQLKVYFELDYYYLATSHISSTRQLLRRKKEKSYHLRNYRNIFRLAAQLLRQANASTEQQIKLRQQIETTNPCTEKSWLLDQLDQH